MVLPLLSKPEEFFYSESPKVVPRTIKKKARSRRILDRFRRSCHKNESKHKIQSGSVSLSKSIFSAVEMTVEKEVENNCDEDKVEYRDRCSSRFCSFINDDKEHIPPDSQAAGGQGAPSKQRTMSFSHNNNNKSTLVADAVERKDRSFSLRLRNSHMENRARLSMNSMFGVVWSDVTSSTNSTISLTVSASQILEECKQIFQRSAKDMDRFMVILLKHVDAMVAPDDGEHNQFTYTKNGVSCQLTIDSNLEKLDRMLFSMAEVIVLEENYVAYLQFLVDTFLPALLMSDSNDPYAQKVGSLANQFLAIVKTMLTFHEERMLKVFLDSNAQWPHGPNFWDGLGYVVDIADAYSAYYQKYELFVNHLDACISAHPSIATNSESADPALIRIRKRLSEVSNQYGDSILRGMSLVQSLLRPIQQLPRYRLHIERFIAYASQTSVSDDELFPNTDHLNAALKNVEDLIQRCNAAIGPSYADLMGLQERLPNSRYQMMLLEHGRELVKHGWITKINSRNGDYIPRYLILCNNLFITASCNHHDFQQQSKVFVRNNAQGDCKLDAVHQCYEMGHDVYASKLDEDSFRLMFKRRVLDFKSHDADDWISALSICGVNWTDEGKGLVHRQVLGARAPVWQRDQTTNECYICHRNFNVVFRRHHCRACGLVVCWHCSRIRMKLNFDRSESVRVCFKCAHQIHTTRSLTWISTSL